ncbi:MAG: prepilin-type N-terminal cleavage/methylation domain-containing protein [Azoarcus sp.]|jgi:prepilin-type N-terminal cleavage/methylation domain-containing protein|nr:prepilin-type N-terminal cleavage/methylation domain-containing protein [Azoarcus sp.]
MSVLSKLLAMSKDQLKSTIQSIDASAVKSRGLRRQFGKIRAKSGGFTLLELLVVVAILAAVASTTFTMLQDTDRRAAAGAHVHAMGQIASALVAFPKLNSNKYPAVWDSLLANPTDPDSVPAAPGDGPDGIPNTLDDVPGREAGWLSIVSADLTEQLTIEELNDDELDLLKSVGITGVRGLDTTAQSGGCTNDNLRNLIEQKGNDVVPSRIYNPESTQDGKGGCGGVYSLHEENAAAIAATDPDGMPNSGDETEAVPAIGPAKYVAKWNADPARVGAATGANLIAFGITDGVSLISRDAYAGLAVAPIYRHVETHEYPGYIVLFNVDVANESVTFQAVVDGAGDTREEELGELDNLRNT